MSQAGADELRRWWRTAIVDARPGSIRIRGYPIEQLVGRVSFVETVWLVLRGELPSPGQAALLEAALVAAVDHGPQAPSIAVARMAVTCGLALNGAVASAVNLLGDVHGGAGQQCMELFLDVDREWAALERGELPPGSRERLGQAVARVLDELGRRAGPYVPGFGHPIHPIDPRAVRLMELVGEARNRGEVGGRYLDIARAVESQLERLKGRRIPMNIDGATAVVFLELGFSPELGRGLFILSRTVGILAHAWEQRQQGERLKGPMPPEVGYRYEGPPPRDLPERAPPTGFPPGGGG